MAFDISTRTVSLVITGVLLLLILYSMGQWLIPFVIGLILAYAFHIPARKLSGLLRISDTFSAAIIISCLVTICYFFTIFTLPLVKTASMALIEKIPFLMEAFPKLVNEIITKTSDVFRLPRSNIDTIAPFTKYAREIIETLPSHFSMFVNKGVALMHIVMFVFMTPILTFYILKDWDKVEKYSSALLEKLFPPIVIGTIKDINSNLGQYIVGQLLVCIILGVVYTICLYFTGIKECIVCGLFSGLMACAPFIGPLISLGTTIIMAVDDYQWLYQYIVTCSIYIVIPFVDSNFLTPKLIGGKIGMQPFWMLFSICATVSVIGAAGVFISVPIAVVMSTICKSIFKKI
ncbi:MAG: AI-2E family transporter [Holosporales bacterium]|jgi:predicted PurR-regulated permease PerM|nr:AI-2E family transporter [Holosporales bacterium]